MVLPLKLTAAAMAAIDDFAAAAGTQECLGFLASEPGGDAITAIEYLPSRASSVHAEASPVGIKRAVDRLSARGLVARGIWHSHGQLPVFHSGTDLATIQRLLPSMAAANARRDGVRTGPVIESVDAAALPLDDGRHLLFTLHADPVPGLEWCESPSWIGARISAAPGVVSSATLDGDALRLIAHGVCLTLDVPAGAHVVSRVVHRSSSRLSHLYSLVVNTRRERYAQCLAVADVGGERFTSLTDCDVIVEEAADDRTL
jgi:proteasome lid subunit RPN8/RPN11